MENIVRLFDIVFMFLRRRFILFGFDLSFWDIFIWLVVAGLVIGFIREVFD